MLWEDIYPELRRGAPMAPSFILEEAARDAAIEFCGRTDVYKMEEQVAFSDGFDEYEVTPPKDYEVAHILSIRHKFSGPDGMTPTSFEDMRRIQSSESGGSPWAFASLDNVFFFVAPMPTDTLSADVIFSVKPQKTAEGLPDTIGLEYRDALSWGALTRLLGQPDTPWRDDRMAEVYGRKFRREINRIARVVKYGFGGASLRVHPRPFM